MIEIESVSGTDIPVLGDYTLKLNQYPLVVIRGVNLNKKAFSKNKSNGSGKTLSVSTIPAIAYNSTPKSLNKKGSRDILKLKKSSLQLTFKNNKRYVITQTLTGASIKYKIETGDTEKNYREARDAQAEIQRIFPISEEQFYSQVFIDGRERTILQRGTAAQRFTYIESVFNLNRYDALNKLIAKDYTRIKTFIQELDVLVSEKQTRKQDLPNLDRLKITARQKQLEHDVGKLGERLERSMEHINTAKTYLKLIEDLDTLNLKHVQTQLDEALEERVTLKKLYKTSVRYWEQESTYRAVLAKRKKYKIALQGLDGDTADIPVIEKRVQALKAKLVETQSILVASETRNDTYKKLKANRDKLNPEYVIDKYKEHASDALKDMILSNRNRQKSNSKTLQHLVNFSETAHDENCPVCRRALDKRSAERIERAIDEEQRRLRAREEKLETTYKWVLNNEEMEHIHCVPKDEIEGLEEIIERTKRQIKRREADLENLQTKQALEERLANLPTVEFEESPKTPRPEIYEDTLTDLQSRIERLEYNVKTIQRIRRMDFAYDSKETAQQVLEKHSHRIQEYRPMLEQMQAEIQTLTSQTSVYDVVKGDIDRLIEKIKELRLETKNFKIYEALRRAYGSKGLKKIETLSRVRQLESNFNRFSSLIYGEPVKFVFQLTESKFDIFIEINGAVTDVRLLSGGESSAFTLLLILSLLPFIPNQNRCSLLVLDEIEIGADDSFKEMFVERFLPVLQKVIPHVVVITPQSPQQFYLPNAANYVVTKKGTRSTIKQIL